MKRNKFNLSHYRLTSFNQGQLVPVGLTEVLPGDTVQQATSALIRVSPQLAPVMHPVQVRIHHWFVPHRIVWEDFEDFITGGPDGEDASVFPTVVSPVSTGFAAGSLADHLGITPGVAEASLSALPFRGYALIWNEWYRDQDLQTPLTIDTTSGTDTTTSVALQNVCWEKDYFTSARPFAQKGPDVTLPLGQFAPIVSTSEKFQIRGKTDTTLRDVRLLNGSNALSTSGDPSGSNQDVDFGALNNEVIGLKADLGDATAATVNELRLSLALQRYAEARARYGSRYTEYLRYLGVRSSDARLQRPEYLGGGKQTIQFSEVLQTAQAYDSEDEPIGDAVGSLKGHGIGAMRSNRYRRFFEEHGYVFTLMSVKPKTMYVQGVDRTWLKRTKEDFFQKELQHIGQQEILENEIYLQGNNSDSWGAYQDRYDEYRRGVSRVAGEFRSTLDYWHMARIFSSLPTLNASFVSSDPTNRIYADTTPNQLWVMANHSIQARRLLAKTGTSFTY